jgi:hypothetical protein
MFPEFRVSLHITAFELRTIGLYQPIEHWQRGERTLHTSNNRVSIRFRRERVDAIWREEHTFGFCQMRNVHFVHTGNVKNVARSRFRS